MTDARARPSCCGWSASTSFTRCRITSSTKSHGLHSLVVAWGPKNALAAAFLAHMVMCGLLLAFGLLCQFRIAYLVGWFIIVGCLVLEHWIARRRSLNWINLAFFRLNAVGQRGFPRRGGRRSDFSGRIQVAVRIGREKQQKN